VPSADTCDVPLTSGRRGRGAWAAALGCHKNNVGDLKLRCTSMYIVESGPLHYSRGGNSLQCSDAAKKHAVTHTPFARTRNSHLFCISLFLVAYLCSIVSLWCVSRASCIFSS
jgi:hypothetical protein